MDTPVGKIGMATCYDLRFPELSVILRRQGAEILTFPSAFTSTTGTHHWFPLLQARAIENQCFVVAAAQIGIHNPSISQRESFGGSCIIDPWGQVLAKCSTVGRKDKKALQDEEQTVGQVLKIQENQDDGSTGQCELAIATLDHLKLFNVRREMPVFEHRRNDVYTLDLK